MNFKRHFLYKSDKKCALLRKTWLKQENWNNENPIPFFKSFYIVSRGEIPSDILLYPDKHGIQKPSGYYSFSKV